MNKSGFLLFIGMAAALHGQVALYVQDGQSMALVQDARNTTLTYTAPLIEKAGKLVEASTRRYALMPLSEYEPIFISVRDFKVSNYQITIVNEPREMNHEFMFSAEFESSYPLDHVFMALELITKKGDKMIYLREIGSLARHEPKVVSTDLPVDASLGLQRYNFHLFVKGREVLCSLMPPEVREKILDQMVARRIEGAADGPPQLFVDPAPAYPESLLAARVTGDAVVRIHIDTHGRVQNPEVVKASDPAFGAAALEAVKLWRFLPMIRHGQPAEIAAEMPFSFAPPQLKAPGGG
ncbi:MAG TPA: energy transducer TonB [Opitutaceae bacterium]|nr:energy transducer TonB [Opitutaceae bacterium]